MKTVFFVSDVTVHNPETREVVVQAGKAYTMQTLEELRSEYGFDLLPGVCFTVETKRQLGV